MPHVEDPLAHAAAVIIRQDKTDQGKREEMLVGLRQQVGEYNTLLCDQALPLVTFLLESHYHLLHRLKAAHIMTLIENDKSLKATLIIQLSKVVDHKYWSIIPEIIEEAAKEITKPGL